jgi:DNA repair protein RadD
VNGVYINIDLLPAIPEGGMSDSLDQLFNWGERQEEIEASSGETSRPLREYQQTAIDLVLDAIGRGERRIVLQLPTGGGKTRIASELIKDARRQGLRVLVVAPRLSLINQTTESFEVDGIGDIGVIQGKHYRTNKFAAVQVASAQTLSRRPVPEGIGLVIVDECHIRDKALHRLMTAPEWASVPFVGLSATPWTKGLGKHFTLLLKPTSITDLIGGGFLVPPKIFCPPGPDLSQVRVDRGDFVTSQLSHAVDTKELVGNVIDTWLAKGGNRPTLVYRVDCAHAQHLQERFLEAGIVAEYIDGDSPLFEREEVFKRLADGSTKIICNVAVADTGVDIPAVSCIVDARPTKSKMRLTQTIGRGLRPFKDKVDCIVLDHSGNVRRLGDPREIDYSSLDTGDEASAEKRKKDEAGTPEAIFCPQCHAQLPCPKPRKCPDCGEIFWAITSVAERDGELVEYGSETIGPATKISLAVKQNWYASFLWMLAERGKNPKAAYHLFVAKFKEEPPYGWRTMEHVPPSVEQRNFVRSRNIAYAKAMARARG